jgi:S-adenosylmethionine:tRNA ribosyltransferase-isomerase
MKTDDFTFDLPDELIAQVPTKERTASRLMHVSQHDKIIEHLLFSEVVSLLKPNDLLVRNNVKVINARLFGEKSSGGKLEFLVERVLSDREILTQIKASKAPKPEDIVFVSNDLSTKKFAFKILEKNDGFYRLELIEEHRVSLERIIEECGHLPLPPYIQRTDNEFDADRYQTVFAEKLGAVAAPTAGLHFDMPLFEKIKAIGVQIEEITLYVGSGTFQPVRVDDVEKHKMHSERFEISQQLVDKVLECRAKGGRVVALGTTSLRALESASQQGFLQAMSGETNIFIYPGYQFKCVDALITNFHLPKSTLLMLVSAFSGKEKIMYAYKQAIKEKYRFFSYGDAMFLEKASY